MDKSNIICQLSERACMIVTYGLGFIMKFQAKAIINAPAQKIWEVLIDSSLYRKFDPFCEKIEGQISLNSSLKIYSKLNPKRAFNVRVSLLKSPQKMIWEGGLPFHLFKGIRTFTLIPKDDFTCEIHVEEEFSGFLLFLIKPSLPDMTESFKAFTLGLKNFMEEKNK